MIAKIPNEDGGYDEVPIDGSLTFPASTLDDPIYAIEVDVIANDDTNPEWTEDLQVRLDDDSSDYIADHPNDRDGLDDDDDGYDEDPDAIVDIQDNDLSFELQHGTLVANYDDDNDNGVTDYKETAASEEGDDDLYPIYLHAPHHVNPGDRVTLFVSPEYFNVYESNSKGEKLLGDNPDIDTIVWNSPADVPDVLWLEVKKGGSVVNNSTIVLYTQDAHAHPSNNSYSQENTTINFLIQGANPNTGQILDITNQTQPWMIGQLTDDVVIAEAPTAWVASAGYQWTVPGNVAAGYFPSTQQASVQPLEPEDLTRDTLQYFWVANQAIAPDTDTYAVDVEVSLNGASYPVHTKYELHSPDVLKSWGFLNKTKISPDQKLLEFGDTEDDDPDFWGIDVELSVQEPEFVTDHGQWGFINIILSTDSSYEDVDDQLWIGSENGQWGLDKRWMAFGPWTTSDDFRLYADAPAIDIASVAARPDRPVILRSGTAFRTYAMYRPAGDSQWVPLVYFDWSWSGVATYDGTRWTLVDGYPQAPSTGVNVVWASNEPVWYQALDADNALWIPV
jgi:hypothetical protein